MKMAQEINTQRALTIAGSVALLALSAYGVWKWNQADSPQPANDDDKKKKSVSHGSNRQVSDDKVEKQSHRPREEKVDQKIIKVEEIKETITSDKVIIEATETVETIPSELEGEIKKELEEIISEIKDEEEYVVVAPAEEQESAPVTTAEENHSCATSSTDETDIWTPEHEITTNDEVDQKKNTPETTSATTTTTTVTEEYIWKADNAVPAVEELSNEEWAANTTAVASAAPAATVVETPVKTTAKPLSLSAPVFVPRQQAKHQSDLQNESTESPKKSTKKRLSRVELIEQQRQNHTPYAKARCSHWPRCTNKNCKFWHPYRECREGEYCPYGTKCMFIHPSDYVEPHRSSKKNQSSDEEDQGQYNLNKQFEQVSS